MKIRVCDKDSIPLENSKSILTLHFSNIIWNLEFPELDISNICSHKNNDFLALSWSNLKMFAFLKFSVHPEKVLF